MLTYFSKLLRRNVPIQREAQYPSPSGEGAFFQQFTFFSDTLNSYEEIKDGIGALSVLD
jgi:hypothetical protein